jgi:hypothetical protein
MAGEDRMAQRRPPRHRLLIRGHSHPRTPTTEGPTVGLVIPAEPGMPDWGEGIALFAKMIRAKGKWSGHRTRDH